MKKLNDKDKQEIRDKIDRLRHLKEPYIIWLQVLISTGIVMLIFILGSLDTQLGKITIIENYTIELFENSSANASPKIQGVATPNKSLNLGIINSILRNIWAALVMLFAFFIALFLYIIKYVKYDHKINHFYDLLTGVEVSRPIKQSYIISFLKNKEAKKEVKKQDLESLFKQYPYTLLVLSIFLLITVEFVGKVGYLNNLMALLSSLIAYFLLVGIDLPLNKNRQTIPLFGFSIIFPIFVAVFCIWTILNIVITLPGEKSKVVWILVWLLLMIYPGIKSLSRKNDAS